MAKIVKFIAPSIVAMLIAAFVVNSSGFSFASENNASPTPTSTPTPTYTPTPTPTLTPTPTPTPTETPQSIGTPTPTPSTDCIATDVHGRLIYSGNHLSGDPVGGSFYNIAQNENCSDNVYVMAFGSKQEPETPGWLESQVFVSSQTYTISQGSSDFTVQFDVPNGDFCWYQVDALRTSEVRIPPRYSGNDMIDYVFVKDTDSCLPASPTPTPTTTTTIVKQEQSQSQTQNNNQTVNVTVGGEVQGAKIVKKQPDTGVGVLGLATMFGSAPAGILLARFRKGRATQKNLTEGEFAAKLFEERTGKINES